MRVQTGHGVGNLISVCAVSGGKNSHFIMSIRYANRSWSSDNNGGKEEIDTPLPAAWHFLWKYRPSHGK